MKKTLLALAFGVSTLASAQADLSVSLTSPMANDVIGPNSPFAPSFIYTNLGTEAIDFNDTLYFEMSVGGTRLSVNGGSRFYIDSISVPANGGTYTVNFPSLTLNIPGQAMTNTTFCIDVYARGNGWTGVTESNTANNQSCANVTYDPSTISLIENAVEASIEAKVVDNSYFANGIYNVDLKNVTSSKNEMIVIDITGKEVFKTVLNVNNTSIEESVNLSSLRSGIYIVAIQGGNANIATKKIIVQ